MEIGGFVDPARWMTWAGDETDLPNTIFYGKYVNSGPGSGLANWVKWAGCRADLIEEMARKYKVDSLIQGSEWVPETGVQFGATL